MLGAVLPHTTVGHSPARSCSRGEVVLAPGNGGDYCYLVRSGVISVRFGQEAVEVGLVGAGGLLNLGGVLGTGEIMCATVAMTDAQVQAISVAKLRSACAAQPYLQTRIARYLQARMVQTTTLAVCHVRHSLEQRLASWIAAATRLLGEPTLRLTHEELSIVLGVRRPSVSLAIQMLEGKGAVRGTRNALVVRDGRRLDALACQCLSRAIPRFDDIDEILSAAARSGTVPSADTGEQSVASGNFRVSPPITRGREFVGGLSNV
jgi:CRP-like cAMP-binding protein